MWGGTSASRYGAPGGYAWLPGGGLTELMPSGSQRLAQSGNIIHDKWRLRRVKNIESKRLDDVKGVIDVHTPPEGIAYRHLVTNNRSAPALLRAL